MRALHSRPDEHPRSEHQESLSFLFGHGCRYRHYAPCGSTRQCELGKKSWKEDRFKTTMVSAAQENANTWLIERSELTGLN